MWVGKGRDTRAAPWGRRHAGAWETGKQQEKRLRARVNGMRKEHSSGFSIHRCHDVWHTCVPTAKQEDKVFQKKGATSPCQMLQMGQVG